MPERLVERHASWVRRAQLPDGAFAGRRGGSDLYYTSFGLRAADLLGVDDAGLWDAAAAWFGMLDAEADSPVSCYCLVHSLWLLERHGHDLAALQRQAREAARRLPRPAGIYDAYLTALCMAMAGRKVRRRRAADPELPRGPWRLRRSAGGAQRRQPDRGGHPTAGGLR
jgi:hypothetical protein